MFWIEASGHGKWRCWLRRPAPELRPLPGLSPPEKSLEVLPWGLSLST